MHLIPVCDLSNYNNHIYLIVFSSFFIIYLFILQAISTVHVPK